MQESGEQVFKSNMQHSNSKYCCHSQFLRLQERWPQVKSLYCFGLMNTAPLSMNTTHNMRTESSKVEGFKSSANFRRILMRKIMPTATCVSQSFTQWPEAERKREGSSSSDISVSSTEDSLPGMQSRREYSFDQRDRKQIISEVDINQWLERETGIDRLRIMYAVGSDGTFIQEDTQKLNTMFRRTVVLGVFVSVLAASTQAAGKKEKHISKSQAVVKGIISERSDAKMILREAFNGTLKFTIFAMSVFHLSQAIAAYRNKSSIWEYTISASLGLGVTEVGQGIKQCARSSLIGALLGSIGGFIACRVLTSEGLNQEQKHLDRIRQYLQQQRLSEQKALAVMTDEQGAS